MTLHVEVVSPERVLFRGEGERVVCRTSDGDIAFLTGHAPFIGVLDIAPVRVVQADETEQTVAVHGGFVEVSHDHVIVLSDVAELPEQIDVPRAQEALSRADARLRDNSDDEEAVAARSRANLRVGVAAAR